MFFPPAILVLLFSHFREITLRLDRSLTAATCSRNRLAIVWIRHITSGKDTWYTCPWCSIDCYDITNLISFQPRLENIGVRLMANR